MDDSYIDPKEIVKVCSKYVYKEKRFQCEDCNWVDLGSEACLDDDDIKCSKCKKRIGKIVDELNYLIVKECRYIFYKSRYWKCDKCGWEGLGKDAELGDVEEYLYFTPIYCPRYRHKIGMVRCLTEDETREHGTPGEKERQRKWDERHERYKQSLLRSADQLPDIDEDEIIIHWDFIGPEEDPYTLIRHRSQILWKEIASYEGYSRYIRVGEILREKYGERLKDFIPTNASGLYLYGDRLLSINIIKDFREALRKGVPYEHRPPSFILSF